MIRNIAGMLGVHWDKDERHSNTFKIKKLDGVFLFTDEGLSTIYEHDYNWEEIFVDLVLGRLEIEWLPKIGFEYWRPSIFSTEGVILHKWIGTQSCYNMKKRVGIYKTKKEAKEKAKELGWI